MMLEGEMREDDETARLTGPAPSARQLKLQQMEFYGFFHFSMNTFTGREWGDGTNPAGLFNPSALDGRQWARAAKSAGMRGAILTCKHHDGFCLWPSRYTDYTVASSPYQGGRGDVVREIAEACREEGLSFGVYLSPWDRHEACYGTGEAYDDYFVNQLTELLTGYGDIFCVWLDGACGEGKNGRKQIYDWKRYYETVRRLQPDACIHICGPDVRWCGNEAGDTRPEEWSVVPARLACPASVAEKSQQQDDAVFRQRQLSKGDQDLGSRKALKGEEELIWYPAEVDTSIRPGWFYHEEEDGQVKSLEELAGIYERSVGGNATLLLNIPPDRRGLVHEQDVARLRELGEYIGRRFAHDRIQEARMQADSEETGHEIRAAAEPGYERYYRPDGERASYEIVMTWESEIWADCMVLMEQIPLSQRVERFEILNGTDGTVLYRGSVIGYKRIASWPVVRVKSLRLRIEKARGIPALSYIGVFSSR